MHCNGKCHLKKELQKEDKKDNSPSNNLKEKYEVQFFEKFKKIINILPFSEREKATTTYLFPFSSEDLSAIFHPPQS